MDGEARLSGSSRPGQRDQSCFRILQHGAEHRDLLSPSHQRRGLPGKILRHLSGRWRRMLRLLPQPARDFLHLDVRLRVVLLPQELRVLLRLLQRSRALTHRLERFHEPYHGSRVRAVVLHESAPELYRGLTVPAGRSARGEIFERRREADLEVVPLALDPVVEFGGIRDVEALQERAAVEIQGLHDPSVPERLTERGGVAPDRLRIEPHLGASPARDDMAAEA